MKTNKPTASTTWHGCSPTVLAYASIDEIPDDLKWLAEKLDKCLGHCQKTLGGYVNCKYINFGDAFEVETHLGANKIYTRAQWQCAKDLLEAASTDECDISQHSSESPAEPEAWDGEGWPPVGECNARKKGVWRFMVEILSMERTRRLDYCAMYRC